MTDFDDLIHDCRAGTPGAEQRLFAAAYPDLRQLARARLRDGGRGTVLDTTALVHESYLRFLKGGTLKAESRRAFFAYAAQVMRSVIIDLVRERLAERRGGAAEHLTLTTGLGEGVAADTGPEVLRLHEALIALAVAEPRLAQVVEMRYFAGYTEAEVADALSLTERTVRRDWQKARLLLVALLRE
jgi:RNA polymerase sigma factor (TIGR02999 family)